MSTDPSPRVRVAAANDYEVIVAGVAGLLGGFPDRLEVRERIVMGDEIEHGPIDVVLYDTYGRTGICGDALRWLVDHPDVRQVAMFSLDLRPALIEDARAVGVRGFISKSLSADEIASAIEAVAAGREVLAVSSTAPDYLPDAMDLLDWPGKADGLSERESQVLVLVAEGCTNPEIAEALYLSTETVKTHVSTVLRKLDLRNRIQAATYVVKAGTFSRFQPVDHSPLSTSTGN